MSLYPIYILTILIGIYAVYMNAPVLFKINPFENELAMAKFFASFFPTVVEIFMIYFGVYSIYNLYKKKEE